MAGEAEGQDPEGTAGAPDGGQAPSEPPGGNSFDHPFLQEIPEEHRETFAPYVQKWDANTTRKFQELHSQYDPYKDFVENQIDPGALTQAYQLYELLNTEPQTLWASLNQIAQQEGWMNGQQGLPGTGELGGEDDPFQGLPPALKQQWDAREAQIQQLTQFAEIAAGKLLSQEEQVEQRQADQELESNLQNWHKEFGDFDDAYVMKELAIGANIEQAVASYKNFVQTLMQQQELAGRGPGAAAPRVLAGGGVIPGSGTDITKASNKDVTSLVASFLDNHKQAAQ